MIHILSGLGQGDQLWRYMSVDKLESLVNTASLHFASAQQFEDEWEGAITAIEHGRRTEWIPRALSEPSAVEQGIAHLSKAFRALAAVTKISCWHAAEHESAAMWAHYCEENKGVAILSTVGHIAESLQPFRLQPEYGEEDFYIGRVQHLDYEREAMSNYCVGDSMLSPFFFKRRHFEHEREVRIALPLRTAHEWGVDVPKAGVLVPAKLGALIQEIRLGPGTPQQVLDGVAELVRRKGMTCSVTRSAMDRKPMY